MQKYLPFLLAGLLAGCAENAKKPLPAADSVNSTTTLPEKIIGERTNGDVTLLDTIDGKPLVSLADNVLLDATMPRKGWSEANIEVGVTPAQEKAMIIKKGEPLRLGGKVIGKALQDLELFSTGQHPATGESTGYFFAYIQEKGIKPGSVIETSLSEFLAAHSSRLLPDVQTFIKQWQLQTTGVNAPFIEYSNYENSVDDPSPGYRIVLVFYKNTMVGVVATRPLQLADVKAQPLERGYTVYFFNDTDSKVKEEYVKLFNNFVMSVD